MDVCVWVCVCVRAWVWVFVGACKIIRFIVFPKVLVLCKMQTDLSRI